MMGQLSSQQQAIMLLLETPDPPELPRRAHVYVWPTAIDPDRRKQELILSWLAYRETELKEWGDGSQLS